jgi:hypothetical protein
MNAIIADTLTDGTHVWIILKGNKIIINYCIEDLEALGLDS